MIIQKRLLSSSTYILTLSGVVLLLQCFGRDDGSLEVGRRDLIEHQSNGQKNGRNTIERESNSSHNESKSKAVESTITRAQVSSSGNENNDQSKEGEEERCEEGRDE